MSNITDDTKKAGNLTDEGKIQSKPKCGIIRPISAMGEAYSEKHWQEIDDILVEVIKDAGFEPNLVSDAPDIGVIQARIVQHLHAYPIVICDVSGANANVMFELGLRLAFDKATIIIKDKETSYNFDTSPLEHIGYRSDLRYPSIIAFKQELKTKLINTFKLQQEEGYSPFLKHFSEIVPSKLAKKEIPEGEYVQKQLDQLSQKMDILLKQNRQQAEVSDQEAMRFPIKHAGKRDQRLRGLEIMRRLQEAQEKKRFVNSAGRLVEVEQEIAALERQLAALDMD